MNSWEKNSENYRIPITSRCANCPLLKMLAHESLGFVSRQKEIEGHLYGSSSEVAQQRLIEGLESELKAYSEGAKMRRASAVSSVSVRVSSMCG